MLAKLMVPLTVLPTGALAGRFRLVAMSAASAVMLALRVLLALLVSLVALLLAVMPTGLLGCR